VYRHYSSKAEYVYITLRLIYSGHYTYQKILPESTELYIRYCEDSDCSGSLNPRCPIGQSRGPSTWTLTLSGSLCGRSPPSGAQNLPPRRDPHGEQESECPQALPACDTCGARSTVILKVPILCRFMITFSSMTAVHSINDLVSRIVVKTVTPDHFYRQKNYSTVSSTARTFS